MEAEVEVGEGVDITMVTEGEQIIGRPDPGPMQEGESSVRLDSNCKQNFVVFSPLSNK